MPVSLEARAELVGTIDTKTISDPGNKRKLEYRDPAVITSQDGTKRHVEELGEVRLRQGDIIQIPCTTFLTVPSTPFSVSGYGFLGEILVGFPGIEGGSGAINTKGKVVPNARLFSREDLAKEPVEIKGPEGNVIAIVSWTEGVW